MFQPKSDAIKIGQDSFKIPARNGVAFGAGSILRFDITRNCGFIDASNSYLEMEIELTNNVNGVAQNAAQPMLNLEKDIGANSLINQMTIRAEGGRVVEELVNYNTYSKIHYNATKTEGALNRRSKLEGCSNSYMPQDNCFYTANRVIPPVAIATVAANVPTNGLLNANQCYKAIRRKVCLPLLGGIFTNPRSFPAMMIPLEVEFILEDALRAMRISNYGDGQTQIACDDIPNDNAGAPGDTARRTLNVTSLTQFNTIGGAAAAGIVPSNNSAALEGEQQLNALNNCWYRVGQTIRVNGGGELLNAPNYNAGAGGVICNITSIKVIDETGGGTYQDTPGKLLITVDDDLIGGAAADGTGITIDVLSLTNQPLGANAAGVGGHGTFGYTCHNPRLVIQKVVPPPAVVQSISSAIAKGEYNQDIISYTNINNAVPANQSVSTNMISADLSRVKSIFSVPTSQANTDTVANGNSLQGQNLDATRYIYQFNTKLVPDRRVQLAVEQFPVVVQTPAGSTLKPYRIGTFSSGFHRYEVEKALRSANINVKNLNFLTNNPATTNIVANNFTATESGTWMVARAMGAGVGTSANMVGKSLVLYLDYNAANATPTKLIKNYLVHVRTISVGMSGVSIFY
tara:strand:- start:1667 stop:3556 length:1890 start_codon:yes stop_codon:yes gene_type:complete